jgi:hypothetical protein
MLDALGPFVDTVTAAVLDGIDWRSAWLAAVDVASKSASATAELRPKVGRARRDGGTRDCCRPRTATFAAITGATAPMVSLSRS